MEEYKEGRPGFSKIFHIETLRRIPVTQNEHTKNAIGTTTHEGRLFPQALSDEFGKIAEVCAIELRCVDKSTHFASEVNDLLLEIDIISSRATLLHRFLLNLDDLRHVHASGWHSFSAGETAKELARLYKIIRGM